MLAVRTSAVAGAFYPADPKRLNDQLQACLGHVPAGAGATLPKMLVVPHAGYVYSGAVAGRAYARLARFAGRIQRVVLLGPAHRVRLRGLAVPTVDAFETPLGRVLVDRQAVDAVAELPQVARNDLAHALEHSIEVQLPFLQKVLGSQFSLLPLVVGDAKAEEVAEVHRTAVGRRRDADRHQLGPVALPAVRRGCSDRPHDGGSHRRPRRPISSLTKPAARTRSTARCAAARRHGLQAEPAGPAQLGRHGRRPPARGRLCRAGADRTPGERRAAARRR